MAKFQVNYCMRIYNGSIEVEADSFQAAKNIVGDMGYTELTDNCEDTALDIETVTNLDTDEMEEYD